MANHYRASADIAMHQLLGRCAEVALRACQIDAWPWTEKDFEILVGDYLRPSRGLLGGFRRGHSTHGCRPSCKARRTTNSEPVAPRTTDARDPRASVGGRLGPSRCECNRIHACSRMAAKSTTVQILSTSWIRPWKDSRAVETVTMAPRYLGIKLIKALLVRDSAGDNS